MAGIILHDFLQGPWEEVRSYLIDELEQIQLALRQRTWPVGSVYSTILNTNPSSQLGFGTWSLITQIVFPTIYMWERIL